MLSAKEYFFKHYSDGPRAYSAKFSTEVMQQARQAASELGFGYRLALEWSQFRDRLGYRHSNDRLLHLTVRRLARKNAHWLGRQAFRDVFVGKMMNLEAGAHAPLSDGDCTGRLCIFNVGLSDACSEMAHVLEKYLAIAEQGPETGIRSMADVPGGMENTLFLAFLDAKVTSFIAWRLLDNEVKLNFHKESYEFYREHFGEPSVMAYSLATSSDQFIVAHEIAHSFIGHTGKDSVVPPPDLSAFDLLLDDEEAPLSEKARREIEADSVALRLILAGRVRDVSRTDIAEAVFGVTLTLATLLLMEDETAVNSGYPPAALRFEHMSLSLKAVAFASGDRGSLDMLDTLSDFWTLLEERRWALTTMFKEMEERDADGQRGTEGSGDVVGEER